MVLLGGDPLEQVGGEEKIRTPCDQHKSQPLQQLKMAQLVSGPPHARLDPAREDNEYPAKEHVSQRQAERRASRMGSDSHQTAGRCSDGGDKFSGDMKGGSRLLA